MKDFYKEGIPKVAVTKEGRAYVYGDNQHYIKTYETTTASVFDLEDSVSAEYLIDEFESLRKHKSVVFLTHEQFAEIMQLVFQAYTGWEE